MLWVWPVQGWGSSCQCFLSRDVAHPVSVACPCCVINCLAGQQVMTRVMNTKAIPQICRYLYTLCFSLLPDLLPQWCQACPGKSLPVSWHFPFMLCKLPVNSSNALMMVVPASF